MPVRYHRVHRLPRLRSAVDGAVFKALGIARLKGSWKP
jgi:hypothetical protein